LQDDFWQIGGDSPHRLSGGLCNLITEKAVFPRFLPEDRRKKSCRWQLFVGF
jgi:hypothetical protein